MTEIRFVDTTLRDGQQSLWALRMRTGMMLPIAERMDRAGFEAIELIAGPYFRIAVRDLREDPFRMIRLMRERITETPLRLIASRINVFGFDPPSISTVMSTVTCTPGPASSTPASRPASLIFDPTGTGAGKRTLFSP